VVIRREKETAACRVFEVSEQRIRELHGETEMLAVPTALQEFEERVGPVLSEAEREEDIDTLGGLVAALAGRVPTRGELLVHPPSGISFEVIQADPRRVKRLRVRNLPHYDGAVVGA